MDFTAATGVPARCSALRFPLDDDFDLFVSLPGERLRETDHCDNSRASILPHQ